ncbi:MULTISPECIES: ANTAR domain-containing protein [unclassified Streptomyces]|uniref:ANTAR domain-containing protein n=1 Tax=unclassified Streptomyces TaxID=2593676 RepID=UPI0013E8D12D|nr:MULTISPECIES: ANTAR domain-containing protein [unclassified Streptomyces]
MTSSSTVSVLSTTDQVIVVCLSGELDGDSCGRLAQELKPHLDQAVQRGRRLVLDLSGVERLSSAACRTLQQVTGHLAQEPVPVVAATPAVRRALDEAQLAGIRTYDTLADALARLPASDTTPDEGLRGEVFGLRSKARTSGLIGTAQGMLMARYDLRTPAAAFALLREGSQHLNVPLRVLSSAVVTAPPPTTAAVWFPGRGTHPAPPMTAFLHASGGDVTDRRQVLAAVLAEALALSDAEAAEVHLTDPAQDDALFLERHHGLSAAYWDHIALVTEPPVVCARAQIRREPVTVPDIAEDLELGAHPAGQALLSAGNHAVHSQPMITADGHCNGTLTLHWTKPGSWLTSEQQKALSVLADEVAAWRSWYRRTVLLDALEYLHQHHESLSQQHQSHSRHG